jgi:hypothetical protein
MTPPFSRTAACIPNASKRKAASNNYHCTLAVSVARPESIVKIGIHFREHKQKVLLDH